MLLRENDMLRNLLRTLSSVHTDGKSLDVVFADRSFVVDEDTVAISTEIDADVELSEADELRFVVDALSHQAWRIRLGARSEFEEFVRDYPTAPHVAGVVRSLVENIYVDEQRTNEFKGLRQTVAFKADIIMADHDQRPPLDALPREAALVEGVCQLALAGHVKGIAGIDDGVRTFLGQTRRHLVEARCEHDATRRKEQARRVTDALLSQVAIPRIADEYAKDTTFSADFIPDVPSASRGAVEPITARAVLGDALIDVSSTLVAVSVLFASGILSAIRRILEQLRIFALLRWVAKKSDVLRAWRWLLCTLTPEPIGRTSEEEQRKATAAALYRRLAAAGHSAEGFLTADGTLPHDVDPETVRPERIDVDALRAVSPEALGALNHSDLSKVNSPHPDGSKLESDNAEQETTAFIDTMTDLADEGTAADWYRCNHCSYRQSDVNTVYQGRDLQRTERLAENDITVRRAARDARASTQSNALDVRTELDKRGLTQEIEKAFSAFGTRTVERRGWCGERLDVRAAVRQRAGAPYQQDVFRHRQQSNASDRTVGVAIDLSRSMDIFEAKVALGALFRATSVIGDNIVAIGFGTDRENGNRIKTPLVTAPNEEFQWHHLNAISEMDDTPTASGIEDVRDLLKNSRERILVVITDGKPNIPLNGTTPNREEAVTDAKEQVREARRHHDVAVIGIGIGDEIDEGTLREMFGQWGYALADRSNLAKRLVDVYRGQIETTRHSD
ncbi:VWA domain-containing protein [Haladaptatus halobius]|uniref:VWA domain-containing protein n=1 Tax=Haladaptatus halobius TaxID=2884875 RepID=UPI001D0BACE5|nr:VWA domain-containing protein [Haladaptatus halobius]